MYDLFFIVNEPKALQVQYNKPQPNFYTRGQL